MTKTVRRVVREVLATSVLDKKFKPVDPSRKRIDIGIHPWAVEIDLKQGCLKSLLDYLAQEQSVTDAKVALELCRLISRGYTSTPYQIIVIERPEVPKRQGGRPKVRGAAATPREREIATRCRELYDKYRKLYVAEQEAAKEFKVNEKTVKRAMRALEREEQFQREAEEKKAADAEARESFKALRSTALEAMKAAYRAGDEKNGHET